MKKRLILYLVFFLLFASLFTSSVLADVGDPCVDDTECPTDGYLPGDICEGYNIFNIFRNYSCQDNVCTYEDIYELVEHCDLSCYGGVCNTHPGFGTPDPNPDYPCPINPTLQLMKSRFDAIDQDLNGGYGYTTDDNYRLNEQAILYFVNGESSLMFGYVEMYQITGDMHYLDKLVYHSDRVMSLRDDYHRDVQRPYGLRDYSGRISKTWSFWQESSERLFVQYQQTTGRLTLPIIKFAEIVYDGPSLWDNVLYDGMTMKQKADFYIERVKESVAEHDHVWYEEGDEGWYRIYDPDPESTHCASPEWEVTSCAEWQYDANFIDEDEGYYACPENTAPIPFERGCVPVGQQGRIIMVMIKLYELTGEPEYLNKLQKYAQFFKNYLDYDAQNDLYTSPRQCKDMYTGWDDITRCPPFYSGNIEINTVPYFALQTEIAYMLYEQGIVFTETDMQRLANTFKENIYIDPETLAWYCDGGLHNTYGEDIRVGIGFFRLVEFDPSIYPIVEYFYVLGPDNPRNYLLGNYYSMYSSAPGYVRTINYCNYTSGQLPPDSPIWPSAQTSSFILGSYTRFAPEAEEMLDWIVNHYDMTVGTWPLDDVKAAGPNRIVLGGSHVSFWTYYNYTADSYKWEMQWLKEWVEANWQNYAWGPQFSNSDEALEDCFVHVTEDMTLDFARGGSLSITAYSSADPTRSRLPGPWDLNYDWIMNVKSPVYRSFWQDFKAVDLANNNGDGYYLDVQNWPRSDITDFTKIREFSSEEEFISELVAITDLIKNSLHQTYPNKLLAANTYAHFEEGTDPIEFVFEDQLDVQIREGAIRYGRTASQIEQEINATYHASDEGVIVTMQHSAFYADWVCLEGLPYCLDRDRIAGLAMYYLAKTDNVYFFTLVFFEPDDPRINSWFEAIEYDIGQPLNRYYVFEEHGAYSDPDYYKIFGRAYTNALVLLKPRPKWGGVTYGTETATTHQLPGMYRPLYADGTLGAPTNSITLRNWEGAVLIGQMQGDVNFDGRVDLLDLGLVSQAFGCSSACGDEDVDGNGQVNILDLVIVGKNFT